MDLKRIRHLALALSFVFSFATTSQAAGNVIPVSINGQDAGFTPGLGFPTPPDGGLFQVWTALDGGAGTTVAGWAEAGGGAFPCEPVSNFGPVGTSDDGPTFNLAITASSTTGVMICVPWLAATSGTYTIVTSIVPKSHATLLLAEGVKINANNTGPQATILFAPTASPSTSTTLAANVNNAALTGPPSTNIVVTSAAGISIGYTLNLVSVDGFVGGWYGVTNVVGTTVTLDRPVLWPLLAGDNVLVYPVDPTLNNFSIIGLGQGAYLQGACQRNISLTAYEHVRIQNVITRANGAAVATLGSFVGLQGYDNTWSDIFADARLDNAPGKAFAWVAEESLHADHLVALSDGTSGTGFEVFDTIASDFADLTASTFGSFGLLLGTETLNASRPGTVKSNFRGLQLLNNLIGLNVTNNSNNNAFSAVVAFGNIGWGAFFTHGSSFNAVDGFNFVNNARAVEFDATGAGSNGNRFANGAFELSYDRTVIVDVGSSGEQFTNVGVDTIWEAITDDILINGDTTWDGFTGTNSSANVFNVGAAHLQLSRAAMNLDATHTPTSGVITSNASAIADVRGMTCSLTTGATCLQNGGGTLHFHNVTATGTGNGFIANGGPSSRNFDEGDNDFSGASIPSTISSGRVGGPQFGFNATGDMGARGIFEAHTDAVFPAGAIVVGNVVVGYQTEPGAYDGGVPAGGTPPVFRQQVNGFYALTGYDGGVGIGGWAVGVVPEGQGVIASQQVARLPYAGVVSTTGGDGGFATGIVQIDCANLPSSKHVAHVRIEVNARATTAPDGGAVGDFFYGTFDACLYDNAGTCSWLNCNSGSSTTTLVTAGAGGTGGGAGGLGAATVSLSMVGGVPIIGVVPPVTASGTVGIDWEVTRADVDWN